MERWLNHLIGGSLENGGAGTVAHMNFIAAVVLGCSPIILLGQDLAYTQGENTHAEGTVLSESKAVKELKLSATEMIVPTNNGKTAITNRAYFNFKHVFEDMIKANPGHYINATLPGIVIEGTEVLPLEKVFQSFCQNTVDTPKIIQKRLCHHVDQKIPPTKTEKELYGTLKIIQKLQRLLKECLDDGKRTLQEVKSLILSQKNYKNIDSLPEKIRKHLHKIDKAHNQADREKIWSLIDDLTLYGLKKTDRMQLEIDQLAQSGPFLQWLSLSLERLNEVARIRLHWISFFGEKVREVLDTMKGDPVYHPSDTQSFLEQIRYYHQTGNLRFANQLLPKLGAEEKKYPEILLIQGKIAAIHTEYEKAKACFKALQNTSFEKDVENFLEAWGNEYAEYTEWALKAGTAPMLRMLKKGLTMAPDHSGLKRLLARIFRMDFKIMHMGEEEGNTLQNLWEDWLSETPEAFERLPEKECALFLDLCAEKAKKQGNIQESKQLIEMALSKEDNAQRRIHAMEICFALEEYNEGLDHLGAAVAQDTQKALHWEDIGDRLSESGHTANALEAYEKGLAALTNHPSLLLKRGQTLLKLGRIEEARSCIHTYKTLIETEPTQKASTDPLHTAETLLAQGQKEAALEILIPLQKTLTENPLFWNIFGTACQMTGRIGDAERCFRQAIFLKPDFTEAHYHLGLLFHENGYIPEARASYENALIQNPDFFRAHINLGSIAFEERNFSKAARHFERVMDLNPLDPNAHFNYAKAMDSLGERQKALRSFKCAMELDPGHVQAKKAHDHLLQHKSI